MKHPDNIHEYPFSLEELGKDLANLRYDCLAKVLGSLASKMEGDAWGDSRRGRHKLADNLLQASYHLERAHQLVRGAWSICLPHMKEEEKEG